jgi:DNA-binding LytR/AlgR family response regulator
MKQLKIGIIEDDLLIAESISVALKQIGYQPTRAVRNYQNAIQLIEEEKPDLLLIDIMLQGEADGIALAKKINSDYDIPFIFLTANSDAATVNRAKETHPMAYLVKPFTEHDLFSSIEIAFNNYNNRQKDAMPFASSYLKKVIFIKQADLFHKLEIDDILYLESDNVYLNIYTASKKHFIVRNKLDDFVADLSNPDFVKVHRSFAVNLKHVDAIDSIHVKIEGKNIPLQKPYKEDLLLKVKSIK